MGRRGMSRRWRLRIRLIGAVLIVLAAAWILLSGGDPREMRIPESQLPPEGRTTLQLIHDGGPFPYERDGITFENREGILPAHDRGYYSEYTVATPGVDHRGARRIVCGDAMDCYYTADHYATFAQIEEGQ